MVGDVLQLAYAIDDERKLQGADISLLVSCWSFVVPCVD